MNQIDMLVDDYFKWLKEKYRLKYIKETVELETPFKNHINDLIRIYIDPIENNRFRISDGGHTLNELDMMLIDLNNETRRRIISYTLKQFNLSLSDEVIYVDVDKYNFAQRKHDLLQGILKIYDLTMTTKSNVTNLFIEEVMTYLHEHEIYGSYNQSVTGASGINYKINLIINPRKNKPEILVDFVNDLNFNMFATDVFKYKDVIHERFHPEGIKPKYKIIANDVGNKISEKVLLAAKSERIEILRWSHKDEVLSILN